MSLLLGKVDETNVARTRGILSGATVLGAGGAAWCFAALLNWNARSAWAIPGAMVATIALLGLCAARLLATRRTRSADDPAASAAGKRAGIWFGIIFGAEAALIAISSVLLARGGLGLWIPATAALIVGIHFLPLARVFAAPIYYGTGIFSVLGVLACLLIPDMALRLLCVGLVMAAVLWVTSWLLLWRTRLG
ncbi:hypothetical protein [Rhodanobacter hydrolyticus]|uniref:DUF2157 domain-containing protein n=1 Tax=Rhodanobacter hydrolyticus TaxID=2250595 RepID=A0ABW8J4Q8_9GAMM